MNESTGLTPPKQHPAWWKAGQAQRPFIWRRYVGPHDLVWLALFASLAWLSRGRNPAEMLLLVSLGLFQLAEPRIAVLRSETGRVVAIAIKLALVYVLMGFTGGIESTYYLLLLLPVVSAATTLGPLATLLFTAAAWACYLSFLLLIDWDVYDLPPAQARELVARLILFAAVAYVAYHLAEANRRQVTEGRRIAAQLAEANRHLEEAQAAYRRSERLAALGQLAAGLAHELRNPMSTMRASAEVIARRIADGDPTTREMAAFIAEEIDRTDGLITRFLDFARPLKPNLRSADLTVMLDRAIEEVRRAAEEAGVTLVRNYSPDLPPAPCDPELIQRVWVNLLDNAIQASPAGAAVTVRARVCEGEAEVAIIDRGSGVEARDLENIFNPFFTTKPSGVGLGLAIVSKVVDEHGGHVDVESEAGRGSVFRVRLPLEGNA
jgi:two-component system, NtrC family, sensor histidine kinase HydH